jgi:hypothetical protein
MGGAVVRAAGMRRWPIEVCSLSAKNVPTLR